MKYTIKELSKLRESEDKVEFKAAQRNFSFAGSEHTVQADRRKCYLGYIVALCNEGGGDLVFGMSDDYPHEVVGTDFARGQIGDLEDEVYKRLSIRVHLYELYNEEKLRVLVTEIPSRPIGRLIKFEGVALMRTGESLRNMSDDEMFKILSEQEPDFSNTICPLLTLEELDEEAVQIMKKRYSDKQNNPAFLSLTNKQVLNDLGLVRNEEVTFAALILCGRKGALLKYLPNAKISIEYRHTHYQDYFDKRDIIEVPLFKGIDEVWNIIDARNGNHHLDDNFYKFDIPYFNKEVIREAVLNAIAHRNYKISSEVVMKQYLKELTILNPGGFPKGVALENLLTVSSTPRNRLLTEVLEKTGLVERAGQGVDKIYRLSLNEGKALPDYTKSDLYQVVLSLDGNLVNEKLAIFLNQYQHDHGILGTFEVIALHQIYERKVSTVHKEIISRLLEKKLIQKAQATSSTEYLLGEKYFNWLGEDGKIAGFVVDDLKMVCSLFANVHQLQMKDFVEAFKHTEKSRAQIKYFVDKLEGILIYKSGVGKGTVYNLCKEFKNKDNIYGALTQKLRSEL